MADEPTQPQGDNKRPEVKVEPTTDNSAELATLKEQNAKLTGDLKTSQADGEKAKRYVVGLVQRFQASNAKPQPSEDPEDQSDEFKEALDEDPRKALDAHFNSRMGPILAGQNRAAEVTNRDRAREKLGPKYVKYEEEINKFMEPMTPITRAEPGAYEEAFNYVRMQHFDDEVAEAVQAHNNKKDEERRMTTEGSSSTSPERGRGKAPLASMEREIMAEMGMDEEMWRKFGGGNASGYSEEPGD